MSKSNGGKFVLGAIVGAVVGAVTGILFAPKSGEKTRKDIQEKASLIAQKGKDLAKKEGQELKEFANKVTDNIKK